MATKSAPTSDVYGSNGPARAVARQQINDYLKFGDPKAMARYRGRVPWDELTLDPAMPLLTLVRDSCFTNHEPKREQTLVMLLAYAVEDGRTEIFDLKESYFDKFVDPIQPIIKNGYGDVLLKYLENGFNPAQPYGKSQITAIEYADSLGKAELATLMRSFVARNTVNAVIDDTEAKSAPKA